MGVLWRFVQVKRQFETKPHIYNQFLDIMKSFKAQTCVAHSVASLGVVAVRGSDELPRAKRIAAGASRRKIKLA